VKMRKRKATTKIQPHNALIDRDVEDGNVQEVTTLPPVDDDMDILTMPTPAHVS